jgi:hypothetical protein
MVDLALLQSVSYIAGASGVCIAAIFYILNLRISQRNQELTLKAQQQTLETRKLQFVTNITNQLNSEEGHRRYVELMNMEWKDYDDFERKYGSDYNIDNTAKRFCVWGNYNTLGMLVREKLVEPELLYPIIDCTVLNHWSKFKDVIKEQRKRYGPEDDLSDFEFLYNEILRVTLSRNPSYKTLETFGHYVPDK